MPSLEYVGIGTLAEKINRVQRIIRLGRLSA